MKKLILILFLAVVNTTAFTQITNAYTGYTGDVLGSVLISGTSNVFYVNTQQDNVGSTASDYVFLGNPCTGNRTAVTMVNLDVANSSYACLLGIVENEYNGDIWPYGNMLSSPGAKNCLFAKYNATTNVCTVDEQFYYTGTTKSTAQISGASRVSTDQVLIWSNTTPVGGTQGQFEVNGIPINWVGLLNTTTGVVTNMGSTLRPYFSDGNNGFIKSVDLLPNGNVIILGGFNRLVSSSGTVAGHGAIWNPVTNSIVDLAIDGSTSQTYTNGCEVIGNTAYIGYSASAPTAPLTAGLLAVDLTTYAVAGTGTGVRINPTDIEVSGGKIIISGAPKSSPPTTCLDLYDPSTGTHIDISGGTTGLFNSTNSSNVVNYVTAVPSCADCDNMLLSIAGNMQNTDPLQTQTYSTIQDIAKYCKSSVVLSIEDISIEVNNSRKLVLTTAPVGSILQKSANGYNFTDMYVTKKEKDQYDLTSFAVKTYFRVKTSENKYSKVAVFDPTNSGNILFVSPTSILLSKPSSVEIYNSVGQLIWKDDKVQNISIPCTPGIKFVKIFDGKNVETIKVL